METQDERVKKAAAEEIAIVPYDLQWPALFSAEKEHLLACLPHGFIRRIEHFGSTAVPGLYAKPVVDMLVEVSSLTAARTKIAPILVSQGYDYFWRPTFGDDGPPFYTWFIKRNHEGLRTHHIHMVRRSFREHWGRLLFRDYLIANPLIATEYARLKLELASLYSNDRVAYTEGKTAFIYRITEQAKLIEREPLLGKAC